MKGVHCSEQGQPKVTKNMHEEPALTSVNAFAQVERNSLLLLCRNSSDGGHPACNYSQTAEVELGFIRIQGMQNATKCCVELALCTQTTHCTVSTCHINLCTLRFA